MTTPRRHREDRFELVDGSLSPAETTREPGRRRPQPAVVAVVVLLVAALLASIPTTREGAGPAAGDALAGAAPASPTATVPATDCDLADPACRVTQAGRWRDRTAAILRSRLDPGDRYFTGYSYGQSEPYEHGTRLDALGLEVYRLEGGGTEVFIQIAKTPDDAVRCGELTHRRCSPRTAANGARLWTTTTTRVSQGVEVQYIPTGSYVITLVGRNTTAARPLDVGVQDLIEIAHDTRLRPPPS